jgi:hypothetical protein
LQNTLHWPQVVVQDDFGETSAPGSDRLAAVADAVPRSGLEATVVVVVVVVVTTAAAAAAAAGPLRKSHLIDMFAHNWQQHISANQTREVPLWAHFDNRPQANGRVPHRELQEKNEGCRRRRPLWSALPKHTSSKAPASLSEMMGRSRSGVCAMNASPPPPPTLGFHHEDKAMIAPEGMSSSVCLSERVRVCAGQIG